MVGMSRNQQQVFSRLMKFDQRHFQIEHDAVNSGLHLIGRFTLGDPETNAAWSV